MANDFTMTNNTSNNRWDLSYTVDAAGTKSKTLNTAGTFVDKNILVSITTPSASATITASKAATAPTITRTATTASGATNVGTGSATTTAPSSGYFVSLQGTAPATTLDITKTVNTAGFISANSQITASASTTATNGSIYYLPITKGVAAANTASVAKVATDGSNAGVNITGVIGTSTTTEPTSGYYAAFTGTGSSKVTTAGWFPTGALTAATSATTYFPVTGAALTFAGGALNNQAATATFVNSNNKEITTTSTDSYNNGLSIQAVGKAGRAAVTYTNTAGYIPAHSSATNASSAVSQASWNGTTYYLTGVKLAAPSSGIAKFDITVPNGSTSDFITFQFQVDTSGNVVVLGPD